MDAPPAKMTESERSQTLVQLGQLPMEDRKRIRRAFERGEALTAPSERRMQYALLTHSRHSLTVSFVALLSFVTLLGMRLSDQGADVWTRVLIIITLAQAWITFRTLHTRARLMRALGVTKNMLK